jgi:hypothetical protein
LAPSNPGEYSIKRALVESIDGGSDYYVTEGKTEIISNQSDPMTPQPDDIKFWHNFEGWKHEDNINEIS